ncbi:LuxR C-terminal-related transcriptional regulator [Nonomuraea glycinis]|uniref:Transcriptional regulator n=1 Tax=Nonomuraea glycinis TaxID=2047744 RepID=A0A918A223_9ACTN|nr:LuxR family transcriptional regulator [Nonomuraea glycinis]MCA2177009.1 LuxR C-terminal-related transcriptional regulator [Nonomuraea glycinis]GGP02855.1 transcriptional regulator [Nonomuraea glycinis]
MLYGRTAETAAIDDLIGAAAAGAGRALVLRGEAGVGKSSLLDLAASRATAMAAPVVVLRAQGVEGEADLAFAALHQLLRPVTGLLGTLPGPQRDAVSGALGLAAPSADRFLVSAGVLSLLAEAAAGGGLLCLADDFQWFDRASADAVLFAARRLRTEKVSMLLAVRGDGQCKGVPELPVGGLDPESAVRLLDSKAVVAPGVRAQLVSLTGGNPLVLGETVALLSADRLAGRVPLPDPLPGGEQLFGEQVARLSGDARRVLLVASLESDLSLVLYAAAHLSAGDPSPGPEETSGNPRSDYGNPLEGRAMAGLHEAESVGLVTVSGEKVRFRHPLVRSAVHASASSVELRRAHAALAGLVEGDRRAWHLAAATVGQDEAVAAALAASAARAQARGGYGDAANAWARAAELTPEPLTRARRFKDASAAAWLGGRPGQAQTYLADARRLAALATGADGGLVEEIGQLRGRFELNSGDAAEAMRMLAAGRGMGMLADACEAANCVGDVDAIIEIGRRARAFPRGFVRDVVVGIGAMLADGSGGELLRGAVERADELAEAAEFLWASAAASYLGEADAAAELAGRAGRVARVSGMTGQLPVVLEYLSTAERLKGRPAESAAIAEEGLALAREAGYRNSEAAHLANLAVVAALRGEEEACRRYGEQALAIAVPHRVGLRVGVAAYALALLDLGLGRFAAAHDRFVAITRAGPGAGHPTVVWRTTPDRVEAAVAVGEIEAAREALAGLERWGEARSAESRALRLRCRGLLDGDAADFEEALRLHQEPFEGARTAMLYGERLRRTQEPGKARGHLRAALETFQRLGAEPWARRALDELRAAGEAAERPASDAWVALTPQELRIARLVAEGASSKEVAVRLFLSPRTIEYHLYKIYPKLGITSRTELARLL